jgi:hypothetical protein
MVRRRILSGNLYRLRPRSFSHMSLLAHIQEPSRSREHLERTFASLAPWMAGPTAAISSYGYVFFLALCCWESRPSPVNGWGKPLCRRSPCRFSLGMSARTLRPAMTFGPLQSLWFGGTILSTRILPPGVWIAGCCQTSRSEGDRVRGLPMCDTVFRELRTYEYEIVAYILSYTTARSW